MAATSDSADLFVVGADFYQGSVGKNLKNGWCDFEALGLQQVQKHFGSAWKLRKIWYIAERVDQDALKGFEEYLRQQTWFSAQGTNVTLVIIDPKKPQKKRTSLDTAKELSFRTEVDAIEAFRGTKLAPAALVISAGNQQSSLQQLLDEKSCYQEILLPPDSAVVQLTGQHRLEHSDLKAAQLNNSRTDEIWKRYENSRGDRKVVAGWLDKISDSDSKERKLISRRLVDLSQRSNKNFLIQASVEPNRFAYEIASVIKEYLKANGGVNNRLAKEQRCVDFIASSLIKVVAEDLLVERFGREPEQRPSIRNGKDLIAEAAKLYPKIEFCESAEKQISKMNGSDAWFGWLLEALDAANCEMRDWSEGPFPHQRLPGPPTPESPTVMNNPQLRAKRCFRTRRGKELAFEWHMKHRAENLRIHYVVAPEQSDRLMIGYVGQHLPTSKNPTF